MNLNTLLILIGAIALHSCDKISSVNKSASVKFKTKTHINQLYLVDESNDSIDLMYKLRILDTIDEIYYDDQYAFTLVKCENRIYVKDSCFGNRGNIDNAINYAMTVGKPVVKEIMSVSLPMRDNPNVYEKVWQIYQHGDYDSLANGYTTMDYGKIELRQGEINYKGKLTRCVKISKQLPDIFDIHEIHTLNFIKLKDAWKLVLREKISINKDLKSKKIVTYCYDTISDCPIQEGKVFQLYHECFVDSKYMTCQ